MTTHDALGEYFQRRGIKPDNQGVDEWLREKWAYMKIFGRRVPVKPLYGYKKVLVLHDVHHLVAGYDTTWTGEFEIAAWELGSGGCGPYLPMWINRVLTTLLYRLQRFGDGFMRLALATRTPILPVAVVGSEERAPGIANLRSVGRLLGMPSFPITLTWPWLGPLGSTPRVTSSFLPEHPMTS